jgi:hypothetical protein
LKCDASSNSKGEKNAIFQNYGYITEKIHTHHQLRKSHQKLSNTKTLRPFCEFYAKPPTHQRNKTEFQKLSQEPNKKSQNPEKVLENQRLTYPK